jgi:N6-adenosine-specific RNA methylase IME4
MLYETTPAHADLFSSTALAATDMFASLPLGHFGAGILDPGWSFGTWSPLGRGKCADQQYRCDPLEAIKALPVGSLFKPDAAIALWWPQYAVHWVPEVLRAWGFEPRTTGAWAKQSSTGRKWAFGQGKIFRCACELYTIGVRGNPKVRSRSVRNLIVAPVRAHSVKPDQLHADMMKLYAGPHVELFARRHYPGWTCWGDQLPVESPPADPMESPLRRLAESPPAAQTELAPQHQALTAGECVP